MASPVPVAPMGPWNGQHAQHQQLPPSQRSQQQQCAPSPANADEPGVQVRTMGLKVHYTFDKDGKVNCLARFPQTLQIQTIPLDETSLIGVVDLRPCIHAVMECSPELASQETDYTIYALDFSEPDTPLVGQGMLSWALDSLRNDSMIQQPKMVTGRVTKNLLGVFGGGNRETLEVRLRLSTAARPNTQIHHNSSDMTAQMRPMEAVMTPTGAAEWNSFMQTNPHIGQSQPQISNVSRVASPAISQGQVHQPNTMARRDSQGPVHYLQQTQQQIQEPSGPTQELPRMAPMSVDPSEQPDGVAAPSSRPSSRTSNRAPRKRQPTGRPRGRPRKKVAEGNTSGYEDGTEGEDTGPMRKRIKTTVVERASSNPFANNPESLRVAASTSSSLRNFRPVLVNSDASSRNDSHLRDVPRAPTPIPDGPSRRLQTRGLGPSKMPRQESALSQQPLSNDSSFADAMHPLSPSQEDGRSPESLAPTPAYSVGSPADIGSSPPVQKTSSFIQSSPPPSSPVLPPMPSNEPLRDATNLATDDLDDLFGDGPLQTVPQPKCPRPRRARKMPTQARTASGIPHQVFQMQDGPLGQDLVHICSYNTPQPNLTPAQPYSDAQFLPTLEMPPTRLAAGKPPRDMPPTPPPTTDAIDAADADASVASYAAKKSASPVHSTVTATEDNMEEGNPEKSRQIMATMPSPAVAPEATIAPECSIEPSLPAAADISNEEEQGCKDHESTPAPAPPAVSKSRHLARSQSAGPLALPAMPTSESAGPSSLSQSVSAEPTLPAAPPPAASTLKRAASSGPLTLPIPASDPVAPIVAAFEETSLLALVDNSDAIPPPSSPQIVTRSNKNNVKKHAIKQRLEAAVMNGEMPPYCCNCGAIETPTWRKIWVQEKEGVPEYCEYSVEPGRVTAIEILRRDADKKPTLHRLVKKSLGGEDDKTQWQELLLCNPCGIWLTKCKSHRPPDRWDKDASRLGQERKKRGAARNAPRPKRSRAKSSGTMNPTSEAYLHTDALGPVEPSSPKQQEGRGVSEPQQTQQTAKEGSASLDAQETRSNPGSTHSGASHGSGTAGSPIDVEFDAAVGSTKRVLFPSPRKEGVLKTLGELHVNTVQTPDESRCPKSTSTEKENFAAPAKTKTQSLASGNSLDEALFKSPTIARPCTPPPHANNAGAGAPKEPFKTPTQVTPSHRPITRSISRSIRSLRSIASPRQNLELLQRTPTKTLPAAFGFPGSASRRRSPRNHQGDFEVFDSPLSRTMNMMFSDGIIFGENELDLSNLPALDGNGGGLIDFGNLLSTDAMMPSSPSKDGAGGLSFDYLASSSAWVGWDLDTSMTSLEGDGLDGS
ncbi:hypothetical protein E4U49_003322 [Claviceps purpurea]|nr:hypothetical protein E4U49_003322 [Claviceps purpurea]